MNYFDGSPVMLGDVVNVPVPEGTAKARVVMLGETYEHLGIDADFLDWVQRDRVLEASPVVLEWFASNPFTHSDPQYAPVGNYIISPLDEYVLRDFEP